MKEEFYSRGNRLEGSSSLYLRQHSSNPVNWLPWTEKAFEEAENLDKPVLVSIGYSTCHWCHVMEEENFSDPEVASLMNSKYINIKVDREEMPAIDSLYMDAVQAMTGRGGWPLHVILNHEKHPFFGGTYFPKENWIDILNKIAEAWEKDRAGINTISENISTWFEKQKSPASSVLPANPVNLFKENIFQYYDSADPGFNWSGGNQKFPPTRVLSVSLETSDKDLIQAAENILEAMADSGLYDRIGGGFHRYATDTKWRIPHFEKMIYDNAQLMGIYARAGSLTGREDFIRTAESIAEYLKRDMRLLNDGKFAGYASAEDADDTLGEGSYYAWPPDEIRKLISGSSAEKLIRYWNLSGSGEIKGPGYEPVSGWIPHPRGSDIYDENPFTYSELESIKDKLLKTRKERPSPIRDDKVLTELNALLLEGFSLLARYTGKYIKDTVELAGFLKEKLDKYGVLRGDGIEPFITDYAYLITGFTAAYFVTGNPVYIDMAEKAGRFAVRDLSSVEGYFYTTAEKRRDVFIRRADSADSQIPSGQNALLLGFSRLYMITGRDEWKKYSSSIIKYQSALFERIPGQFGTMLQALMVQDEGYHAVVTGNPDDPDFQRITKKLLSITSPDFPVIIASKAADRDWSTLNGRRAIDKVEVLICSNSSCLAPVGNEEDLVRIIDSL